MMKDGRSFVKLGASLGRGPIFIFRGMKRASDLASQKETGPRQQSSHAGWPLFLNQDFSAKRGCLGVIFAYRVNGV